MDSRLTEFAVQCAKRKKAPPILVMIRPTKRCVARCQMCSLWKENVPDMPFEKIEEIIESTAALGTKEVKLTGGEPLLYKHFFETMSFIKENGLESSFITNGVLLNKRMVEKVLELNPKQVYVSIDFPSAKPHNKQRGYHNAWEKAIEAIKEIRTQRKNERPAIVVNFVISNKNFQLLPKFIELGKGLFGEINLIPIRGMSQWFLNQEQVKQFKEEIWPEVERKARGDRIKIRSGKMLFCSDCKSVSKGEYNKGFYGKRKCFVSEFMAFIDTNGDVFPCSNTPYDKSFSYGNAFKKKFKEIWQSKKLEEMLVSKSKVCLACEPTSLLFNQRINKCVTKNDA